MASCPCGFGVKVLFLISILDVWGGREIDIDSANSFIAENLTCGPPSVEQRALDAAFPIIRPAVLWFCSFWFVLTSF